MTSDPGWRYFDGVTKQQLKRMSTDKIFDLMVKGMGWKRAMIEFGFLHLQAMISQIALLIVLLIGWGLWEFGKWLYLTYNAIKPAGWP